MAIGARLRLVRDVLVVCASGLFDEAWYLRRYPRVALENADPCVHYLTCGWRHGNDPGPRFQTNYYLEQNPNVWANAQNPLLHFIRGGFSEGRLPAAGLGEQQASPRPMSWWRAVGIAFLCARSLLAACMTAPSRLEQGRSAVVGGQTRKLKGQVQRAEGRPTVLVCAHVCGPRLFGAERSLLDLLEDLQTLDLNVIVSLPSSNAAYEEAVAARCSALEVFAYPQWSADFPALPEVSERFAELITRHDVAVVHANTIMLREPLEAARRLGRVCVVHAREVIDQHQPLAAAIGRSGAEIAADVLARADFVIANSATTAGCYGPAAERVFVVSNRIDFDALDLPNSVANDGVRVGLISNNSPDKGIEDFVALAAICESLVPQAEFLAIGPESEFVRDLRQGRHRRPNNLRFPGYAGSPAEAVSQVNIVVGLSRVAESFGRSVAEAMAASRPVIAYARGAMGELVVDGKSGFLVSAGDVHAVADRLRFLCEKPERIDALGASARRLMAERFAPDVSRQQLGAAYDKILPRIYAQPGGR